MYNYFALKLIFDSLFGLGPNAPRQGPSLRKLASDYPHCLSVSNSKLTTTTIDVLQEDHGASMLESARSGGLHDLSHMSHLQPK